MEGWRNLGVALHAEVGQYVAGMRLAARETKEWARTTVMAGEEAAVAFRKQSTGLDQFGSKLNRRVTLPLLAVGAASVKLAYDFDTAFSTIESKGYAAAGAIGGLKNEVLKLSDDTGVDSNKLANALVVIMRDGYRGAAAMAQLTAAAKGTELGLGDASDVAKTLDSAMHAYEGTGLTVARTLDIITAAAQRSNADVSKFGPALGQLIPVAADLGIGFDQVAGSLAYLSKNAGGNVAVAASGLRFILQQLEKVGAPAQKALAGVGMSADSLRADIADRGLLPALTDLEAKLGGGSQALLKVFPNARAVSGIMALLANSGKGAAADIDAVTKSTGTADTAIVKLNKTDNQKLRKDFTQLKNDGIRLGDELIPVITKIGGGVAWMGHEFDRLPGAGKDLALVGLAFVALAGPMLKTIALATKVSAAFKRIGDARAASAALKGGAGAAEADGEAASGLLGLSAGTLGAAGLALGAVGGAAIAFGIEAHKAAQRAHELADSIAAIRTQAESTGKSDTQVFNEQALPAFVESHQKDLDRLGISAKQLKAAVNGSDADWKSFIANVVMSRGNLVHHADAVANNKNALTDLRGELVGAKAATAEHERVLGELGIQTDKATASTKRHAKAQHDDAAATADAATASLQAWQAARQRLDGAEKERTGLQAVSDAQDELTKARAADAANSPQMQAAQQGIITAERSLASAQRDSLQAQRDLTKARIDAELNLRNLKNAAIGAGFAERSAQFNLLDAQQAIDNMALDASDEDRAKAQLALEQAQQGLVEAGQAKGDANSALANGPAQNALNLAAAQQRVNDSVNAEADARRGVADAARSARQVQVDADRAVRDAEDKVNTATLTYIQTLDDGAAAHLKLTDSVIDGYSKLAATLDPASTLRKNLDAYIRSLLLAKKIQDVSGVTPAGTSPNGSAPGDVVPGQPLVGHSVADPAASGYVVGGQHDPPRALVAPAWAPRGHVPTRTADVAREPAPAPSSSPNHTTNIYTQDAKPYIDRSIF